MSSMQFDRTSQAGEDRSASNVLVSSDRRLNTFLQKMSIVSADMSIADFLVIFISVCDIGNRVLSCSMRGYDENYFRARVVKYVNRIKTEKSWSQKN
jgi:hypothetical protein